MPEFGPWLAWLEVGGLIIFLVWMANLYQIIVGGDALQRRLDGLKGDPFENYRAGLRRGLARLSQLIGDDETAQTHPWSAQAYLTCLGIAAVYPALFSMVVWTFFPDDRMYDSPEVRVGSWTLLSGYMPQDLTLWPRVGLLLALFSPLAVSEGMRRINFLKSRPLLLIRASSIALVAMSAIVSLLYPPRARTIVVIAMIVSFGIFAARSYAHRGIAEIRSSIIAILVSALVAITIIGYLYWNVPIIMLVNSTVYIGASTYLGACWICIAVEISCAACFVLTKRVTGASVSIAIFANGLIWSLIFSAVLSFGPAYRAFLLTGNDPDLLVAILSLSAIPGLLLASGLTGLLAGAIYRIARRVDQNQGSRFVLPALMLMSLLPPIADAFLSGAKYNTSSFVIFLTLLPAINAPFDWASLGFARWIVGRQVGLTEKPFNLLEGLFGHFLQPLVFLINAAVALFLACLVVLGMVTLGSLFDRLYEYAGALRPLEVSNIVYVIHALPGTSMPQFWWIYSMVMWTFVPTLVYFIVYAGEFVALALKPLHLMPFLAHRVETARHELRAEGWLGIPVYSLLLSAIQVAPGLVLIFFGVEYFPTGLKLLRFAFGGWPINFDAPFELLSGCADWIARAIRGEA